MWESDGNLSVQNKEKDEVDDEKNKKSRELDRGCLSWPACAWA